LLCSALRWTSLCCSLVLSALSRACALGPSFTLHAATRHMGFGALSKLRIILFCLMWQCYYRCTGVRARRLWSVRGWEHGCQPQSCSTPQAQPVVILVFWFVCECSCVSRACAHAHACACVCIRSCDNSPLVGYPTTHTPSPVKGGNGCYRTNVKSRKSYAKRVCKKLFKIWKTVRCVDVCAWQWRSVFGRVWMWTTQTKTYLDTQKRTHAHTHIRTHTLMCGCLCKNYTRKNVHTHTHIYVHTHLCVDVCDYVWMFVCVCVCMCTHTHTYTHTHTNTHTHTHTHTNIHT